MNERMYYVLNEILNLGYTNAEVGINYISRTFEMTTEEIADELHDYFGRFFCPDTDEDLGTWDDIQTNYLYVYSRAEDVEIWMKQSPDFSSVPAEDGDNWIFIFA